MRADELIRKRRDRSIAIIMNIKEREVDKILKAAPGGIEASRRLRKVILDQMNEFCDLATDVALSGEAGEFWFNDELWNQRLGEIRGVVRQALEEFEDELEVAPDGNSG